MPGSGYTLLIVESPVIARIVQKLAPSYVYVLATGGYPWNPVYDSEKHRIKKIADPDRGAFRKELKNQAKWASRIIVATDNDPSGDFIAWSIASFVSPRTVHRSYLKNLTRTGILKFLQDVQELQTDRLETALQNRYLIQNMWYHHNNLPDYYAAALAAVFGSRLHAIHFLDEQKNLYKSSSPISCEPDNLFLLTKADNGTYWDVTYPVSTYETVEFLSSKKITRSFEDAQLLLRKLFETELSSTEEPLISYPRTQSTGFYSESWETIHSQFLQVNDSREFKPPFLRNSLSPDAAHESIHPLQLKIKPDHARKELHSDIAALYKWIYNRTLKAVSLPEVLKDVYLPQLLPDQYFYPIQPIKEKETPDSFTVSPCMTISDLGKELAKTGTMKPSRFGTELDRWLLKKWVTVDGTIVKPGRKLTPYLDSGLMYKRIFKQLQTASLKKLSPETVSAILTS